MMFLLPFVFLSGFIFPIGGMPTRTWCPRVCGGYRARNRVAGRDGRRPLAPIGLLSLYTAGIIGLAVLRFKKTVGVWLVAMDRAARRQRPIEEQTTHVMAVRRRP